MHATLREVADRLGTPAYVYFWEQVVARATALHAAFGDRFVLSYAVKANPNRALLRKLSPLLGGLDVSSGGELEIALEADYPAARLSFSGPAKTRAELNRALEVGVGAIVVESVDEARTLGELAVARGARPSVLVRVNPAKLPRGFGVSMSHRASHFGIDEEDLDAALEELRGHPELDFAGFHVYAGTQCLVADAIADAFATFVSIWSAAAARHELRARRLVFGSGFGIPYDDGQAELDLGAVAARVNPLLDRLKDDPWLGGAERHLELGRFLVGRAGFYVTRVIRMKTSRGKEFCIMDGGLHHHLAASGHLGNIVRRNYPMFKVRAEGEAGPDRSYQLVGPLCTSIDLLGADVRLPTMKPGDLVAIESSGAYGPTASPVHFISHKKPREALIERGDGGPSITDVTADSPIQRPSRSEP